MGDRLEPLNLKARYSTRQPEKIIFKIFWKIIWEIFWKRFLRKNFNH